MTNRKTWRVLRVPLPLLALLTLLTVASGLMLGGCRSMSYQPVSETSFQTLAAQGCSKDGQRLITTARINKVYEDSVILWDGTDASSTYTVRMEKRSVGERVKGVVSTTPHERAFRELQEVQREDGLITVTLTCRGRSVPPTMDQFSYRDSAGNRQTIEL